MVVCSCSCRSRSGGIKGARASAAAASTASHYSRRRCDRRRSSSSSTLLLFVPSVVLCWLCAAAGRGTTTIACAAGAAFTATSGRTSRRTVSFLSSRSSSPLSTTTWRRHHHHQQQQRQLQRSPYRRVSSNVPPLFVSIGLGPEKPPQPEESSSVSEEGAPQQQVKGESTELVPGVDYEIPNHEEYRKSRRSKLDEACDAWFTGLLRGDDGSANAPDDDDGGEGIPRGILKPLAAEMIETLLTPVPLVNDVELPLDHEEWTPYVSTKLPWKPLLPAYGLEQYGLPIPRRNAETWRHFYVPGMVAQSYSIQQQQQQPSGSSSSGVLDNLSEEQLSRIQQDLESKGGWLADEACQARLVYIDGKYAPQLSKTGDNDSNPVTVQNLASWDEIQALGEQRDELVSYLGRLTDGFTDDLVVPVHVGDPEDDGYKPLRLFSKLSGPDHNQGSPTSQFAINAQQGTACFAALNTIKTSNVALVHAAAAAAGSEEAATQRQPVLIVQAVTPMGGVTAEAAASSNADNEQQQQQRAGTSLHPRTLIVGEKDGKVDVVQSTVDLDVDLSSEEEVGVCEQQGQEDNFVPKLHNGYTQIFVKEGANVTHQYLEESGGIVTAGVELPEDPDGRDDPNVLTPRQVEAQRPGAKNVHLETVDVHLLGAKANYQGTVMSMGGHGFTRIAASITLLHKDTTCNLQGFLLAGGNQRSDMKTNIHHVAPGCESEQVQKNMIGGRAVGSFRGRIRVEQSAQQTAANQISRSVLLSDNQARAWAVPSLEIIADDVTCTHGATVSDLSEEELFYLRSRGLSVNEARNLLMYAFAADVAGTVHPAMLGSVDSQEGLQHRVMERLNNLVPQGERAIQGEFQSI